MGRAARVILWSGALLVGGAVVNVMVAWGCSRWCDHWPTDMLPPGVGAWANKPPAEKELTREDLPSGADEYLNDSKYMQSHASSHITRWSIASAWCTRIKFTQGGDADSWGTSRSHTLVRFGWPLRSMQYVEHGWFNMAAFPESGSWRVQGLAGGWPEEPPGSRGWFGSGAPKHWYPMTVLPVGFAVDSVVFGALLYPVILVPGMIVRRFRRRRGLCGKCGYPIGVSPVCTECGAVLRVSNGDRE